MNHAHVVEETFLAPVGSALLWTDSQVIERDGWYQVITPSTRTTQSNEVIHSRVAAAEAATVVDTTIGQYAAHRVPFKWCVGPLTEPADMGALLSERGFASWAVRGMVSDVAAWTSVRRPGITVESVSSVTLPEYQSCFARGWETTIADPVAWNAAHVRALATGRFHFFLARIDGEPAGTAGYVTKPRCAYLVGGNVLTQFRARGVYRALLDARMAQIKTQGQPIAVTQAREATSAPILEALGFESVYRSHVYRWEP